MDGRERLQGILDEFNAATDCGLALDAENSCLFPYGEITVSLHYLPASETLLVWTLLPHLGKDDNAVKRAEWMLARMDGLRDSNGFTYSLAGDSDNVMLADRRTLDEVGSADGLAAWVDALACEAGRLCYACEQLFPYIDDDPLPEEN